MTQYLNSEAMMEQDDFQKKENFPPLFLVDGGTPRRDRREKTFTSGEVCFNADVLRLMSEVGEPDGEPVTRALRRARYGEGKPLSVFAGITERAAAVTRGSERVEQQIQAIIARLSDFVRERFAKHRRGSRAA